MASSPPRRRRRIVVEDDENSEDGGDGALAAARLDAPMEADAPEDDGANSEAEREQDERDGEDLDENAAADYVAIPELDRYDEENLDHREYRQMDYDTRRRAEKELEERDRDLRGGIGGMLDEFGSEDEDHRDRRRGRLGGPRRRRDDADADRDAGDSADADGETDGAGAAAAAVDDGLVDETEDEVNLEAFNVPLRDWIAQERTRREVKRRFQRFLLRFGADEAAGIAPLHEQKIREMCQANLASLEVSYPDLCLFAPVLAVWLADAPKDMIEIMDEVARAVVLRLYPSYGRIHDEVHVRIADLPIVDRLRDLREQHLDAFVKVHGVVTRRTGVFPQLKLVKFTCVRGGCGAVLGPFKQSDSGGEVRPGMCPVCGSPGPFKVNQEETVYRNYQKITLQEAPGSVPPGRVPRYKDVILLADLIDRARPGEEVEVTGVYARSYDLMGAKKSGFPVFNTLIEANFLQQREDLMSARSLTDEDKAQIQELSKDPDIARKIITSIAPSIFGHTHVKTAIALSLFGGCAKNINNKHRIRGDINVLLLGDPGTAKSQVLKYCEKTAPRAVYTTGKGASAVGLTAGVHKDPMTKEWTLEGGALVLADKGMCLIDEFDKMNEQDRTSIHEAMEQQQISVSKAGIVTSLQARCAVVAAANPIGGRYDASITLAENVELTDPILQRFDILCVLQDLVDPVADEQLARFVIDSHRRSHPYERAAAAERAATASEEEGRADLAGRKDGGGGGSGGGGGGEEGSGGDTSAIPQALLKKYIMYARTSVRPQLHNIDQDKIARLYADLRRESASSGGVPIAVRHIESIMRMSEAHARMHLRDHVREDDVDAAIATLLESFIQAQKIAVRRTLKSGFRKYLNSAADYEQLLMHELRDLTHNMQIYEQMRHLVSPGVLRVDCEDLEARARELNIYDLSAFYNSAVFRDADFSLEGEGETRVIVKRFISS